MNERGFVALFTVMVAVAIIILALALAPVVKTFVDNSRNGTTWDGTSGLDCSNTTISEFDKASCTAVDIYNPVFFGVLIAIAGAVIGAKVVFATA